MTSSGVMTVRGRFRGLCPTFGRAGLVAALLLLPGCGEAAHPEQAGPAAVTQPATPGSADEDLPLASLHIEGTPFEIARPAIWEKGFAEGEGVLESWIHPQVDLFPNLNVTLEEPPAAGEDGAEQLLERLAATLPGFEIKEAYWQTVNGIRGLRSVSTWPSIYGDLTALRMMIPWKGKVVLITIVDFTPSFEANAYAYHRCIDALAPFESIQEGEPG